MKAIKILLLVISVSISLCILTSAGIWVNRRLSSERTLQITAAKLGVKPTWDHVRFHVYCRILAYGRTKSEVDDDLKQIGEINIEQAEYGFYIFQQRDLKEKIEEITIRYDDNRRVKIRYVVGRVPWADSYDGAIKNIDCVELEKLAR